MNKMSCFAFAGYRMILGIAVSFGSLNSASALTINITPSDSIQVAINQVNNAGGGTVNLSAGTYVIWDTTVIFSNITLNGAGIGSTIIEPPNSGFSSELISDGSHASGPVISNVTIENMTLNGLGMSALESMGIQICPAGTGRDSNMTLKNLEIENCAQGSGGPSNCNTLTITGCNFHNNGVPVQGNPGLDYQNIYIRNDTNVTMNSSYFNNSPYGCGLKWGGPPSGNSGTVAVTASGNALSGIVLQGSGTDPSNVTLLNCITDNNLGTDANSGGICGQGSNITINGCYSRNNKSWGILTWSGTGTVENCTVTGNTRSPQYQLQGTWTQSNDH